MEFYEEDEPLEEVLAAFAAGEEGVTAPPGAPRPVTFAAPTTVSYVTFVHTGGSSHPAASHAAAPTATAGTR